MDWSDYFYTGEYIEIPHQFYSDLTEKPFTHCIECGQPLGEPGIQYIIEKAIKNYPGQQMTDTLFEYAMCLDCYWEMAQSLSQLSQERIAAYFEQRVDLVLRRQQLAQLGFERIEPWISNCVITGKPASETSEYQIIGQFDGPHLLYTYLPFMISGDVMEDVAKLLSAETRRELDNFGERHFGPPPEVKKILNRGPLVMI
ncbi:MAG: hypothetical protein D6675_08710 [Gemmatimonadetes bacterium]|nr:MAG: hypothetical protein D6675_08710 [Gemmatimonadota bacterium]